MKLASLLRHKPGKVITILEKSTLGECLEIMNSRKIGAMPVLDGKGNLTGIISERDVLRKTFEFGGKILDIPTSSAMTPSEKLITSSPDDDIGRVMEEMTVNKVRHLPVMENGKLVSIVSIGDVVKFLLDSTEIENEGLKNYISGKY